MKIHIHLIGIGNADKTRQCIESMDLGSLPCAYTAAICNNGPSGDYDDLMDLIDVHDTGNIGVAGAWNYGIEIARKTGADAILLTPNDSLYPPGSFRTWVEQYLATGHITGIRHRVHTTHKKHVDKLGFRGDSAIYPMHVFDEIGTFDEHFLFCWYEDLDFEYRLRHAGYSFDIVPEVYADVYPGGGRGEAFRLGVISRADLARAKVHNITYLYLKWFGPNGLADMKEKRMIAAREHLQERIKTLAGRVINNY